MKIIISHDVDHLYVSDHLKRDLIIEKLWIRSGVQFLSRRISFLTLRNRLLLPLNNRMHRIEEIMEFDKKHNIPSVFFFGMDNALGLSYKQMEAKPLIRKVMENGFDVGVHGINYLDQRRMCKEHDDFSHISGKNQFGIRNHYVRYDKETFNKQEKAGYLFDTSLFDKKKLNLRLPFKVGQMWEFPLHIMDGYSCSEGKLKEGLKNTFEAIDKAAESGMPYCTILFHDYLFNNSIFPDMKRWYIRTVKYCEKHNYPFVSYRDAIMEMDGRVI